MPATCLAPIPADNRNYTAPRRSSRKTEQGHCLDRTGDIVDSIAASTRIRALLDWAPEFDNLDTIVRHALAWERRLMAQDERSNRRAISA